MQFHSTLSHRARAAVLDDVAVVPAATPRTASGEVLPPTTAGGRDSTVVFVSGPALALDAAPPWPSSGIVDLAEATMVRLHQLTQEYAEMVAERQRLAAEFAAQLVAGVWMTSDEAKAFGGRVVAMERSLQNLENQLATGLAYLGQDWADTQGRAKGRAE